MIFMILPRPSADIFIRPIAEDDDINFPVYIAMRPMIMPPMKEVFWTPNPNSIVILFFRDTDKMNMSHNDLHNNIIIIEHLNLLSTEK
jgi:hypothetical protein